MDDFELRFGESVLHCFPSVLIPQYFPDSIYPRVLDVFFHLRSESKNDLPHEESLDNVTPADVYYGREREMVSKNLTAV